MKSEFIGKRFGKLVIISETEPVISQSGIKQRRVICQCDCGNTMTTYLQFLIRGSTKSCGRCPPGGKLLDIPPGQRFGRLTVISEAERAVTISGKKLRRFLCQCDCGNTKIVRLEGLLHGSTKSCGCLLHASRAHIDLVGQKFGSLTVISEAEPHRQKNGRVRRVLNCQCECGSIHPVLYSNLVKPNGTQKCRYCQPRGRTDSSRDLTGNRYGRLVVLRRIEPNEGAWSRYQKLWLCACDCGKERIVREENLVLGQTRSCGCLKGILYRGARFGKLTLVSRLPHVFGMRYWNCHCDCGQELTVSIDTLFRASNICCECRNGPKPAVDLTGKVFGRLTVLMEVDPVINSSGKKHLSWLCRCVCGREIVVREQNLKSKNTRSCGCLKRSSKKQLW